MQVTVLRRVTLSRALSIVGAWGLLIGAFPSGPTACFVPGPAFAGASIEWTTDFEGALARARSERRFVMVDFYTTWCSWCKVLDKKTFTDDEIIGQARRMITVKVNAEQSVEIARRYGVGSFPTVVFLHPDGRVRHQVQGYLPPDQFLPEMKRVFETAGEAFALRIQIEDDPRNPQLRAAYADLLALSGTFEAAAAQLDTLVLLSSGDEHRSALLDRAVLWVEVGRTEDAAAALEVWLAENASHPRRAEATYHLARALAAGGDTEQARQLYKIVENLAPDSWLGITSKIRLAHLKS